MDNKEIENDCVNRKVIQKKWMDLIDREDCSLNMLCDDELLLDMARALLFEEDDCDLFKRFPKEFLQQIFVNATKCFTEEKYVFFIVERLNRFGIETIIPVEFDAEFQTLINKAKNDDTSESYARLLIEVMSKMACNPGETLFFLVSRCIDVPTLVPIVGQMLSKTFRPICLYKDDRHIYSHLTSIIKHKTSSMSMNLNGVKNLIREAYKSKYRKYGLPVIDMELIVMSWSSSVCVGDLALKQLELLNQVIVSNITGRTQWTTLNLVQFILWFYGAFLQIFQKDKLEVKESLIKTLSLVIEKHIQRKITEEELEKIREISVTLMDLDDVVLMYLLPFLDKKDEMLSNSWRTSETFLVVATTDDMDDLDPSFLMNEDIIESIAFLSDTLTITEMRRTFDYMLKFATFDVVVSAWSLAIMKACDLERKVDGVTSNFVTLVRENWGEIDEDSDSGVEDDPNVSEIIQYLEELERNLERKPESRKLVCDLIDWIEEKLADLND